MSEELIIREPNAPARIQPVTPRTNPVLIYLAALESEASRRTMTQALARIADLLNGHEPGEEEQSEAKNLARALACDWTRIEGHHIEVIKSQLGAAAGKRSTANKWLCALRGVLRAAHKQRLISAETLADITGVKGFKHTAQPAGREVSDEELMSLALACRADQSIAGRRDAALLTVAYGAGLRRFELAGLTLKDWNASERSLSVWGKGNKERKVYLSESAARVLVRWLDLRESSQPGAALFCPVNKGGKQMERGMTAQAIYNALAKRAKEAGIAAFTPHDLRRTFISDLLDAGADISTVAALAGHADVKTTQRYDRRGERAKKAAANKLQVPF